ncbi:MAG: MFS transporter [Sphingomicrobium sp.]
MTDPATPSPPSFRYAAFVVGVLIVAYTFSYIDRTILTLMVKPIRATLQISDVQISLLHGLAFALFYTFLGIPIGRLIDRRKRTTIVAVGIAVWSIMTALCGLSNSFAWMFAARIGVGIGEAALSPAAYSMLADYFSGKRLVRALSFYQSAVYLGPALATVAGGVMLSRLSPAETVIGHLEPWQQVFVIVGLPGLLIALVVSRLREPERRGSGVKEPPPSFGAVLGHMRNHLRAYGLLILGVSLQSVMWNGSTAWYPTHFMRAYDWTPAQVAAGYGPALAVFGTSGGLFGGWLAGRMRDWGWTDSNVRIGIFAALGALPFGFLAPLMPTGNLSLAMVCGFLFFGATPYGGIAASFQEITPNRMRGQVSAIYLFGLNIAGIGFGGTIVALVTAHVYGGDEMIGRGISTVAGIAAALSAVVLITCLPGYRRAMGIEAPEAHAEAARAADSR